MLVTGAAATCTPPGVDGRRLALALAEDTYEVVAALDGITPVLVMNPAAQADAAALAWPGTTELAIAAGPDREVYDAFAALSAADFDQAALIVADVPDLPGLLIGKLFRGLARAEIAVCPDVSGAVVAYAARLPLADWAAAAPLAFAGPAADDAIAGLRRAAPARAALSVGPGWHRLRRVADLALLDPGLEGWECTRALLSGWSAPADPVRES